MNYKTKILNVAKLHPMRGDVDVRPGVLVQEKDDKGVPGGPAMVIMQVAGQDVLVNYQE